MAVGDSLADLRRLESVEITGLKWMLESLVKNTPDLTALNFTARYLQAKLPCKRNVSIFLQDSR